jgi:NAD dependent epimerase/dehydratase family enzyme
MSWITLEDVVGVVRFVIDNGSVRGTVNVVAPQPAQNEEFTKVLAKTLHRPALLPAPAFALRLVMGEMADALLLSSQRVAPSRLERSGYGYHHVDLSRALLATVADQ